MNSELEKEITEEISRIKEDYEKKIKPLIEKKQYALAKVRIADINYVLLKQRIIELEEYSDSGLNFVAASMSLEERLKEGKRIENAMECFEAYLAQVEFSQKSKELLPE